MTLTVNGKKYKYKFDKELTYEVIGFLFNLNYTQTGLKHLSAEDLFNMLFLIDITCLIETYCTITGLEYNFDYNGLLTANDCCYSLLYDDLYLRTYGYYPNIFNKKIVCSKNIGILYGIIWDNLSEYVEDLITRIYGEYMCRNIGRDRLKSLFESDVKAPISSPLQCKYITLDFLVDKFNLDINGVTEMLALHNVGRL